jgi:predicted metalloprotease with PDZ domain
MTARSKKTKPVPTAGAPEIEFLLQMPQPWTHYFEVTMTLRGIGSEVVDLVMPVWTPGSYLVREFARNVEGFTATGKSGVPLAWCKTSKNRWRISSKSAVLRVAYRVYAFERSVRTSFLDRSHATVNGSGLFMYVDGRQRRAHRLRIEPFPGWTNISTALKPADGEGRVYLAPDYDTLVDSPIEIGNQQIMEFSVREVPHRVSISGEGNFDTAALCADLQKVVECAVEIMGDIPYPQYAFLISLASEGNGGLEHANSMLMQVNRWTFKPRDRYKHFLELAAHEFFHVWNVKRIRPEGLGPFDYGQENYTRLLWVAEGFTDYYAGQILRRAGFLTPDEYLDAISKNIKELQETPGRRHESLAEASFEAWIRLYRKDENFSNRSVSYYLKGGLVGLLLDLEIRNRSGRKSLDDVMRLLYAEYYRKRGRGFTEDEFRAACEKIAGDPLDRIFEDYCYGTGELDFSTYLGYAGLGFKEPAKDAPGQDKGYLGISAKTVDGRVYIAGVTRETPAFTQGLNVNDEIIAINGFRVDQELLTARIGEASPGEVLEFLVSRDGRLLSLPITLGKQEAREYRIERLADPTPKQKRICETWLRADWGSFRKAEGPPPPTGQLT